MIPCTKTMFYGIRGDDDKLWITVCVLKDLLNGFYHRGMAVRHPLDAEVHDPAKAKAKARGRAEQACRKQKSTPSKTTALVMSQVLGPLLNDHLAPQVLRSNENGAIAFLSMAFVNLTAQEHEMAKKRGWL